MRRFLLLLTFLFLLPLGSSPSEAASYKLEAKYSEEVSGKPGGQYSAFPIPLNVLKEEEKARSVEGIYNKLKYRVEKDPFNLVATLIFIGAILHTFLTGYFTRFSHRLAEKHERRMAQRGIIIEHPDGHEPVSFWSSVFHFLGEVEAVFGIWVIPLLLAVLHFYSFDDFKLYLGKDCAFVEPLFVVVIMIIASSRPLFRFAEGIMSGVARLGKSTPSAWWLSVMCIAPILGSFITEPAAMTIGAMILSKRFYALKPSSSLAYATLGLLFVGVSIGGTLTHFAAPPVVMISEKWGWGLVYMMGHFGWKAVAAIVLSTVCYFLIFRKEFRRLNELEAHHKEMTRLPAGWEGRKDQVPLWVTIVHLIFLVWTVLSAHVPVLFIGGFVFFLGFMIATPHHQNQVALRIPIMVGFFLAGLVILGGVQAWWLEPVLTGIESKFVMLGATLLTAFNDNAAVTYLASTVGELSESVKYAVVAGAVAGGGLTVIANAPNPAGQAILNRYFMGINPLKLFLAALLPTVIAYIAFTFFITL